MLVLCTTLYFLYKHSISVITCNDFNIYCKNIFCSQRKVKN